MPDVSRRNLMNGLVLLVASWTLATASQSLAAAQAPLALKGYDPVAYFTAGHPVRGRPEIAYEWDEHRYLFASDGDRGLFEADPVHYAPQFSKFCAMALTRGELHEADPENWLIVDGRLYIFEKPVGPGLFQQDLAGNIAKANQNRSLVPQD